MLSTIGRLDVDAALFDRLEVAAVGAVVFLGFHRAILVVAIDVTVEGSKQSIKFSILSHTLAAIPLAIGIPGRGLVQSRAGLLAAHLSRRHERRLSSWYGYGRVRRSGVRRRSLRCGCASANQSIVYITGYATRGLLLHTNRGATRIANHARRADTKRSRRLRRTVAHLEVTSALAGE